MTTITLNLSARTMEQAQYVSGIIREPVAAAAQCRCEYCQTAQEISGAQRHVEHIIPISRGGSADEQSLCLV